MINFHLTDSITKANLLKKIQVKTMIRSERKPQSLRKICNFSYLISSNARVQKLCQINEVQNNFYRVIVNVGAAALTDF